MRHKSQKTPPHNGASHTAPSWLLRPGRAEIGEAWGLVQHVYGELTGLLLPEQMPPRERRRLDVVLTYPGGDVRAVEIDEIQHFTGARSTTLEVYDDRVSVGFDVETWRRRCEERRGREPGSGFARPCPPLFPGVGGRHRQRAFRDFLADVVPSQRGWLPTVRISDVEVKPILASDDPARGLASLWRSKTSLC